MVMAYRRNIGLLPILLLAVGSYGWASSGSPRMEPPREPSPEELASAFSAKGRKAWTFTPASSDSTRVLRTTSVWDIRRAETISVRARIAQRQLHALRLRWVVTSRLGAYAAAESVPVPIIGTEAPVEADVSLDGGALIPVGHQRPWDALAASEVKSLGLRAEVSGSSQQLKVELSRPQITLSSVEEGEVVKRRLLELRAEPAPADIDAAAMLVFRIDPLPGDPFAPDGEGDVSVHLPDGFEAMAFLDQPQMLQADGWASRYVPTGPPVYRAYLPVWPKNGSFFINCGAHGWQIPAAAVPRTEHRATAAASAVAAPSEKKEEQADDAHPSWRWQPPLEIPFPPPGDPFAQGLWSGAPEAWRLEGNQWKVAERPKSKQAWRPVTFWNHKWGCFGGLGRPDFNLVARVDARLLTASKAKERRPLVLLDGEGFIRHGTFTWLSHPLYVENGGLLYGPGELLRTREGFDYCRRVARYSLARWGRSKSVSCFVLTARPSTPGVAEFHDRFAESIRGWLDRCGRPLYSLHPFTREPRTVKPVEGIGSERPPVGGAWRWGLPQPERISIQTEGMGAETRAMLELTARARQMSVCAIKPYRIVAYPYHRPSPDNFHVADALVFDVWLPSDAPSDMRAGIHLRDRNGLWFQTLLPGLLNPGDWTTCMVDLRGENPHGLKAVGHKKAWTDYSRGRLKEVGLHVFSTHPDDRLRVRFANVRGVSFEQHSKPEPRRIDLVVQPAKQVKKGEVWEAHLRINHTYDNPFDPCQVDLAAVVKTPSGRTMRVPAFWNQPCERREEKPGGAEILEPVGEERFTVRYRVLEPGPHQVTFELREGGTYKKTEERWATDYRFSVDGKPYQPVFRKELSWVFRYENRTPNGKRLIESLAFKPGNVVARLDVKNAFVAGATAPHWRGFIRVDPDRRHFRYDDGSFYYAIGPCLRSPSDNRLPYVSNKFHPREIDRIGKRGTYQFDEYMAAFGANGINWTRVWMCSWWCGLQWRRDWPNYHGIGRYNLVNAWRLDHVLREAERLGIHISLCLTNHGQVSRLIDTEWKDNPYNRALGGPLRSASEFFTRSAPQMAHMNMLRYIAARWGHSPAILTWDLFSELEYTEEYRPYVRWPRPDSAPRNIDRWHQKMSRFLKHVDVNQHMVASHYSRPIRGYHTLALPEIDVAASNAYSAFEEIAQGRKDASAALADFWQGNDYQGGAMRGYRVFGKPVLVEEQGRHWMGAETEDGRVHPHNTREQLDADLHAGLWGSIMQPLAGATGYWWWLHLHYDQRYGEYKALANFVKGEDFRASKGESPLEPRVLSVGNDNGQLKARVRASSHRAYAWVYHIRVPVRAGRYPTVPNARIAIPNLRGGVYTIEFWDTHKGVRTSAARMNHSGGALTLKLPPVVGDIAIKVKPAK